MKQKHASEHTCPNCKNKLVYWVSDDYYFKGKKFFSCEVCDWKPTVEKQENTQCPNGCDGVLTVCSDCPPTNSSKLGGEDNE